MFNKKLVLGQKSSEAGLFSKTKKLDTHADLLNLMKQFKGSFLFIGHGSKGQFKDINVVYKTIDKLVKQLNSEYGKNKWIAVFGGDNFTEGSPDIAHVMKYLKEKHKVPLLAIQSDVVIPWGGVDQHIDYVNYIPTVYKPKLDEKGMQIIENGQPKQVVHWGGLLDGIPQGPTGVYLGEDFRKGILKGVVAVGGGPIGLDEAKLAFENGVRIRYIRAETKFPEVNGQYGSLDQWAYENNLIFNP